MAQKPLEVLRSEVYTSDPGPGVCDATRWQELWGKAGWPRGLDFTERRDASSLGVPWAARGSPGRPLHPVVSWDIFPEGRFGRMSGGRRRCHWRLGMCFRLVAQAPVFRPRALGCLLQVS